MDLNMLQEIGNQIAPIARDTIPELITAFITTMFLNKNAQSKEYLNKLKSKKIFEVAEGLLENGHITYLEFYKCNNFLKIAKLADKQKNLIKKKRMVLILILTGSFVFLKQVEILAMNKCRNYGQEFWQEK